MIKIIDKETGVELGTISEEELKYLIDQLEEEHSEDKDYFISQDTLAMFEQKGIDPVLLDFLRKALGDRESIEIEWKKC